MSDRDGVVFYCDPPVPKWLRPLLLIAMPVGIFASLHTLYLLPLVLVLEIPQKVRFRARQLELRWLLYRRDIAYTELAGFDVNDQGIHLRKRDDDVVTLQLFLAHEEKRRTRSEKQAVCDGICEMLTRATGLAKGGAANASVKHTASLDAVLSRAMWIAQARGGDAVEPDDFIEGLLAGPEREPLLRAGLRSERTPELGYREGATLRLGGYLETMIANACIAAVQSERREITPADVILEVFREGDASVKRLLERGLTPMRLLDSLSHGFSPAESDARAYGKLTREQLLERVLSERARLVIHNDPYTPTVVLVDLFARAFPRSKRDLEAVAAKVAVDGHAYIDGLRANEAARVAIEMMQHARRLGSPLRVTVEADPGTTSS